MTSRLFLTLLIALLASAPAQAGWFPADTIDGPSAEITDFGDLDLARDGTGGLVYVKVDGGVPHVFLSRHVNGAWRSPERVDNGVETAASQPVVAAAAGHRLAIAWVSGGRLYGSVVPGGGPGPLPAPTQLHADADPLVSVRDPHADMGINGTAYVVFSAPGGGGSDVRGVRLQGAAWEPVVPPLDIQPGLAAGDPSGRPRVAVSAEGNAVAVWGEDHQDGRRRIYGRRITGLATSLAPQEISLPEFEGKPAGDADSPDLDIEDDGSYSWAVWRQDFAGSSRAVTRRLVGSLYEAPSPVEATGFADAPRISMTGRGAGFAVSGIQNSNAVVGTLLFQDVFGPPLDVVGGGSDRRALPVVAASEKDHIAVAWRGAGGTLRARHKPFKQVFDPEVVLNDPALGVAGESGIELTEDRMGNFVVGFLQGGPTNRRVMVAEYDRPPGLPNPTTSSNNQNRSKPRFKWSPGLELFGPQIFRVIVDGDEIGRTSESQFFSPVALDDGPHRWQVIAVDRRGQENASRVRIVRIDRTPPDAAIKLTGKKKAGALLRFSVTPDDFGGSGIKYVQTDFGDRSPVTLVPRGVHRWRRAGKYTVRLKVADKAGNVARLTVKLRIKK